VTTPLPSPDPKPAQPASRPARRTQAERRSETIGLLLRATTDCLVARGYANTTTQEVAHRAGLSQGAIFRHFASRQDLMVATAEHLSQTCMAHFETQLKAKRNVNLAELDAALEVLYEVVSTPIQAAWFELQVAARTDAELQLRMQPIFDHNRQANIAMAERLLPGLLEGLPMAQAFTQLYIYLFHGVAMDQHFEPQADRRERLLGALSLLSQLALAQLRSPR
jgi:AcrR family transcriptional regulator